MRGRQENRKGAELACPPVAGNFNGENDDAEEAPWSFILGRTLAQDSGPHVGQNDAGEERVGIHAEPYLFFKALSCLLLSWVE